jgi:hypothetical protein
MAASRGGCQEMATRGCDKKKKRCKTATQMEKYAIFGSGCDQSLLFWMQKMANLQR